MVETSGVWRVGAGDISPGHAATWHLDTENLTYSNPFSQKMERVWFDGKVVYAVELGEVALDPRKNNKVAQEYQIVYAVQLDADRLPIDSQVQKVPDQFNIYDSVPGMAKYSPIWQFNYVIVPRDYKPNTLRSERDCQQSGYPIVKSHKFEN